MDDTMLPVSRDYSPKGLPYTTTSQLAFKYEAQCRQLMKAPPMKRTKSVNSKPLFKRSNSITGLAHSITRSQSSTGTTSLPSSSSLSSGHTSSQPSNHSINPFFFPEPAKQSKRIRPHLRSASSPAIVSKLIRSQSIGSVSSSSTGSSTTPQDITQLQDLSIIDSSSLGDDLCEELEPESKERASIWKFSQRWRRPSGKGRSIAPAVDDWDSDSIAIQSSKSLSSSLPPSLSRNNSAPAVTDNREKALPPIVLSVSSRPKAIRVQTMPLLSQSSQPKKARSQIMNRAVSSPQHIEYDSDDVEECEELSSAVSNLCSFRGIARFPPRIYDDNEEWKVHESYQWLGHRTPSTQQLKCLAKAGWTLQQQ